MKKIIERTIIMVFCLLAILKSICYADEILSDNSYTDEGYLISDSIQKNYESYNFFEKAEKILKHIPTVMQIILVVIAIIAGVLNLILKIVEKRINASKKDVNKVKFFNKFSLVINIILNMILIYVLGYVLCYYDNRLNLVEITKDFTKKILALYVLIYVFFVALFAYKKKNSINILNKLSKIMTVVMIVAIILIIGLTEDGYQFFGPKWLVLE